MTAPDVRLGFRKIVFALAWWYRCTGTRSCTQQYYLPPTTFDSSFSKVLAPLAIAVYNGLHH